MIMKTKNQRVCMLLPDNQTLNCFIEQMHDSQKFALDPKEFNKNIVILGREYTDEIKLQKHKELNIDIKSLDTFLKLPRQQDDDPLLKFLGFESISELKSKFETLITVLRSGQAAEEVLRRCLKQRNIYSLSDLTESKPTNFKKKDLKVNQKSRSQRI